MNEARLIRLIFAENTRIIGIDGELGVGKSSLADCLALQYDLDLVNVKVTAEGIGAVILGSAVFWAYFSYLSRPVYARRWESISKQMPDGSSHSEERETSTMTTVDGD